MNREQFYKTSFLFLVLLFSFLFLYKRVFLKNEVIIPGDIPYNTPVWQGEAPDQKYYKAQNYLLSDQINQFYVWHYIAHISMRGSGVIPLWNPYIFGGQPLVGNSQSALFYPPNLLLFFFDPGIVATLRAIFNILILIIFGFLLGRQLGISRPGSVLISAGFALSGPVTVWLGHPHANVFSWFPFLLWSGEKLIGSDRKTFWAGIFGLATGISILGGHPETVFHMFLILSVYFFFRILFSGGTGKVKRKSSFLLIIAMIIGIMIGSIQLIPFTDFLFRSSTLHGGGRGVHDGSILWSDSFTGNLTGLATMIYPNFFGNPPDRTYNNPVKSVLNYNEQAVYFGLIPLSFFFIILFRRGNSFRIKLMIFISLISLGVAWRAPILEILNHMPVLSFVSNGRLKIFFTFLAVILSGYGFDLFRKSFTAKRNDKKILFIFLAVPLFSILVFVLFSVIRSVIHFAGNSPLYGSSGEISFFKYLLFKIFSLSEPKTMITVLSSLVLIILVFLLLRGKIRMKAFEISVVVLCVIDLTIPALNYNPTIKKADILPSPRVFSEFIKGDAPFRVISDDPMRLQNYNAVHGIHLMGGYDLPVIKRYGDLFSSQNRGNVHNHSWIENSEMIDLLNVKYYFNKGPDPPVKSKYKLIFNNLNYRLYRNTDFFPRAFMVYDYEIIPDDKETLGYLKENDFRLRDKVVLRRPVETLFKKYNSSGDVTNNVQVLKYENDMVKLEAVTEKAGILVLTDVYMPGWEVKVDDDRSGIYLADYAFRAVFVPAGKHIISFKYNPVSFRAGKILSIAGMLIMALFLFLRRREK